MCATMKSSNISYNLLIKMFVFAVFVAVTFCIPVKCQTDGVTTETNTTHVNVMPLPDLDRGSDESILTIQRILTNLSILNDDSSEYDTTMVMLLENTTHSCLQQCIEEETYFLNEFGLKCQTGDKRPECYRARCFKGCELWWQALKEFEPCQEACSSTQFYPFDLPCISACETTQRQYWHFQRLHVERLLTAKTTTTTMTTLLQPQLLHDNETLNTLTLKWPIPTAANTLLPSLYLANRPFNIQYQYVLKAEPTSSSSSSVSSLSSSSTVNDTPDINSNEGRQQSKQHERLEDEQDDAIQNVHDVVADDNNNSVDNDVEIKREVFLKDKQQQQQQWWNLADYNCNENFECDIMDGLMPYTSYKFRFQIPFGDDFNDVLYSEPSEVYTTPAMGLPISKPLITQALALDDTHIAVLWQPGKFISGPLKHYRIVLQQGSTENELENQDVQLLKPNANYFIYSDLSPSTWYNFRVNMLNGEGEGPFSEVNVKTKPSQNPIKRLEDLNTLIVAGEYSLVLKSLDPLVESRVLYKSEEILTDFDVHQYNKRLFVVDKKGTVVSLFLDDTANYTSMNLMDPETGFVPNKLAVDWLNQKLYIAGKSNLLNSWLLKRLNFNGSGVETITTHLKPLRQLQVDPLNGWIFAATENSELCRLNLLSKAVEYFGTAFNFELFSNRFRSFLLTSFNHEERSIYEFSYDLHVTKRKSWEMGSALQGDILWFEMLEDWLIMSNGSFMLRQYLPTQEMDLISFKEIEWCWKIKPLMPARFKDVIQPLPKPLREPLGLQAILSPTKANISWQPPLILEGIQTKAAWQQWDYELDILDVASNNAFNIRNIKSEYFQVERLQPNNLYKIKVRAMFAGLTRQAMGSSVYSEWSEELITRTWPLGEYNFLWASAAGLWESQQLLQPNSEKKPLASFDIKSLKQVNTSLYYVDNRNYDLKCLNLINPEVLCGFEASNAFSVDYDWRGGQLYWSDTKRNCVIRSDLKGSQKLLMPIFGARVIKVDSLKGYIYYTTEARLVRRKLNGALPGQEVEYYHSNGNSESILGFALDFSMQQIYWWVLQQEMGVKLFTTEVDFVKTKELLLLPHSERILPASFSYLKEIETFIWLQEKSQQVMLSSKENFSQLTQLPKILNATVNFVLLKQDFVQSPDLNITPEAIDKESIVITEGYWDDFNIKWSASNSLGNFSIFYRVLLTSWPLDNDNILSFEVNQPIVRVTEFKMAGHDINVTILPLTVWAQGVPVTVKLTTPSAAPKQPRNLRVFVDQFREPLQEQSNITALVRWDSPENISSEKEVFYKVYCWFKEDLHSVKDIEDMGRKAHEVRFYNLQREESYMFQVQAFSLTRSKGGEKTSLLTHFINPEAQAVPRLMFSTHELIAEIDLDLNVTKKWVFTSSEVEHLALMSGEQRVLWVNENVELMSYQPGSAAFKLARMRAEVLSLTVDWISRKVYWAEMSSEKDILVDVYELDLNIFEGKVIMGTKIFSLKPNMLVKNLISMPYSSSLLWLEYEAGSTGTNSTLQGRNLTDLSSLKLKNYLFYKEMFEGSLLDDMETVNLVDLKGKLYSYELQRQLLTTLKIPEQDSAAKFQRDAGFIYSLLNSTLKAFNRRKHNLEFTRTLKEAKLIKAFNYQEYPSRECLIMEKPSEELDTLSKLEQIFVQQITENLIVLNLWKNNPYANCKIAIPGLKYKVLIKHEEEDEQLFHFHAGKHNITQLKPFTNYTLNISMTSYYQQKFSLEEFTFPTFTVRTQEGNPTQPLNFSALAISPSEILVQWQEPLELNAESLNYQLYWQVLNSSLTSHKIVETFEMNLLNLEPSQEYLVWLEVYSKPSKLNSTEKIVVKTFAEPEELQLIAKEAYNLTLLWQANTVYDSVILECRPLTQEPDVTPFSIDLTEVNDNITITNLEPKTKYEFFFKLKFNNVETTYVWPEMPANYFIFETQGDAPGKPGQPQIEHITGEIFKVFWEPAKDNGAAVIEYSLEALKSRHHKRIRRQSNSNSPSSSSSSITMMAQMPYVEELKPVEDKWSPFCNTSELSCIVKELHTMRLLMFRVRARNEPYGWGPYSEDSERVLEPFVSPQKRNSLILAIIAPAAIVTTCVIILFVIRKVQKRRLKAKQLLAKSRPSIWSNFSTMQQQMASRNRAFSMASSATMYTGGPLSDADIALLPHINWSQITLLNFLGSGAFGEVYEGLLKYEGQEEMEKVAIKSLRKGASEFAELLQEAQLMSNFKHENIISLIGVCCDTESISIIMEHMEAGDLLSYLRESRPNSIKPVASLQLLDLMTMCIDVATGMAYLEDMHFVHRDLACRNCLVSSRVPSKRMVKIGDFGLARDIYKSDYYRKEGEALMPVRWMAPESLVDGVFTTQSDVWAFGVLCWEILTLGQQPYAARNNFEVLNYVKEGGRLEQPDNCPDKLFCLMSSCWQTDPDERPSFRKCLNTLLAIKTDVRRVNLGYNMDDNDYALYANQHGIVLSTFLTSPNLNKVPEDQEKEQTAYEIKQNSLNDHNEKKCILAGKTANEKNSDNNAEKNDLKVRFNNNISMKDAVDKEAWKDDESHLIDAKVYRIQENPDYYANEGVSRL